MQYKMIVLDLDDTLLDEGRRVSSRTKRVLNNLKNDGIMIVIATGRMYCSALPYMKQIGLSGMMITYNGAYIKDTSSGELFYHQPIAEETARNIIEEAEDANLHLNLYIDDRLFVEELNEYSQLYEEITGISSEAVGKLSKYIYDDPTKLLIIEKDRSKQQYYQNYFREKYQLEMEVTESKSFFIEFMDCGVSKGKAVEILAGEHGFKLSEVIAIGDNWNDLDMIRTAGLGIAMENAPDDLKREADMIAPFCHQEGVAAVLEDIFT
ncbi:MAG: Cof-type HAD-IIB family hydrolase [Halanaerobiales bacterium]